MFIFKVQKQWKIKSANKLNSNWIGEIRIKNFPLSPFVSETKFRRQGSVSFFRFCWAESTELAPMPGDLDQESELFMRTETKSCFRNVISTKCYEDG
jgi:hypothetical protein